MYWQKMSINSSRYSLALWHYGPVYGSIQPEESGLHG